MHKAAASSPTRRLFTALVPDAGACTAIDAARRQWGGLPARVRPAAERMHLTLQFFDAVDAAHEAAWQAALATLRFAPFDVELDRAELWHAPRDTIAVLRAAPSPPLAALHAATDALARTAGLAPDRRPWKPHLTVLRQAGQVVRARLGEPVRWRVHALHLVWSDLAARPASYRRLLSVPAD